jgi:hypothetical protein
MFDSLEEQMKRDEDRISTRKERITHYALYVLLSGMLFGGLIFAIHLMS